MPHHLLMSTSEQTVNVHDTITQEELVSRRFALPDELKPPRKNQMHLRVRHGYKATEKLFPMDNVPLGLRTLRAGRFLQPPMVCYGWAPSIEQLVDIADSKGFLGATTRNKDVRAFSRINLGDTQHLLQHAVRDDLGISTIIPEVRTILPKSNNCELVISLWTIGMMHGIVHPRMTRQNSGYLGLEESPKWYLDYQEGKASRPRVAREYGIITYRGVNEGGCPRCKIQPL
ncbi:hypothetical protein CPB84DRAFT_1792430 [Gymnopilus junonius]|uniref:Uncharacterized protein n=1 Tax=Gymnopilus junonius TaxID=109634 RepID=A0A9P5TIK4_GYMJU|nr:hypothetical protein CPB84DRAFT_1792430 [Gymnopilus junonius]